MTAQPNREVAVLNAALELPAGPRGAYLAEACAGDPALRQRVEALLQAHEQAGGFLETPPSGLDFERTEVVNIPLTERPGHKIGRYKLLQQIGEGGCGVVYMAEQEEPVRRRVALKVIKVGMDTRQVIARFEAERQALALMDHPNIARVLDAGATDTGRPYFVMELVRGVKITDFCDENKISTQGRLKLFIQVCQAIQHAHQKGVIHRDIKPSNILVTINDGVPVPKVIDFGIAKATQGRLTNQTLFTAFEQFIGTPAYMSPEQAVMTSLDIDTRSDIYSLGVLLYELLTGRTPFDQQELLAAGLDEMRRTIREKEPPKPSTRLKQELLADGVTRRTSNSEFGIRNSERDGASSRRLLQVKELIPALRGDLDWIVMKCLAKDRQRRYETANGLASDVRRHLNCEPVIARPPSRLYEFQMTVRRHRFGFAAGAALLAVFAIGVVVSTLEAIRATQAEREQSRLRQIAETKERKSEQVAQFLKDMLSGVGPSIALGRDTTMLREIVDKTAERMGKDLTNQPEVEVELCLTLAATYHDLGLYKRMEAVARQSLRVARSKLGEENESVAASLTALGDALQHLGEMHVASLEEAEEYSREGLAMSRKLLGNENPKVANALQHFANVLAAQGKMSEAEPKEREALTMHQKLIGIKSPEAAKAMFDLGLILSTQANKLAEAETVSRDALAMQRQLLGDDHPEVAKSLRSLALVLSHQGKWPEAEATNREALAMWKRLQANDRVEVAWTLKELAFTLMQQDKLAEAEFRQREALAMQRRLFGNEHAEVLDSLYSLTDVLQRQGKLAEAEALCREELSSAVALFKRSAPGDPKRSDCIIGLEASQRRLADMLVNAGRSDQAEQTVREAFQVFDQAARDVPSELLLRQEQANCHSQLAAVLEKLGRLDEAEREHHTTIALFAGLREAAPTSPIYCQEEAYATWMLGVMLQGAGRRAAAVTEYRGAIALYQEASATFPNQAGIRFQLIQLLREKGKLAGVEGASRAVVEQYRKNAEGGDPGALNELAWFLAVCSDSKARDGQAAVGFAKQAVAATNRKNPLYLDTLAAAYAETGDYSEAVRVQKEAIALLGLADEKTAKGYASRLILYDSGSPYHEAD